MCLYTKNIYTHPNDTFTMCAPIPHGCAQGVGSIKENSREYDHVAVLCV